MGHVAIHCTCFYPIDLVHQKYEFDALTKGVFKNKALNFIPQCISEIG